MLPCAAVVRQSMAVVQRCCVMFLSSITRQRTKSTCHLFSFFSLLRLSDVAIYCLGHFGHSWMLNAISCQRVMRHRTVCQSTLIYFANRWEMTWLRFVEHISALRRNAEEKNVNICMHTSLVQFGGFLSEFIARLC